MLGSPTIDDLTAHFELKVREPFVIASDIHIHVPEAAVVGI